MSHIDFQHKMAAHCETGTVTALLNHAGLAITEPMVLGLGAGIFFAYLETSQFPFPMVATRTKPGKIREKVAKRLNLNFTTHRFRDRAQARQRLDELLDQGIAVAAQVDMFYMDYIPRYMKAHFNGHYIVITGKEGDTYHVSDSYYPTISELSAASLEKVRFALGDLAPKGFLFYPGEVDPDPDLNQALVKGIKEAAFNMTRIPIPFLGVKGIRLFAAKVVDWPKLCRDIEHLSHEIMTIHIILEERGTGGAGFRYMYATFLQQAAKILDHDGLAGMSGQMMEIGDHWRDISLFSARIGKSRDLGPERLKELQQMILDRADEEEAFFKKLRQLV